MLPFATAVLGYLKYESIGLFRLPPLYLLAFSITTLSLKYSIINSTFIFIVFINKSDFQDQYISHQILVQIYCSSICCLYFRSSFQLLLYILDKGQSYPSFLSSAPGLKWFLAMIFFWQNLHSTLFDPLSTIADESSLVDIALIYYLNTFVRLRDKFQSATVSF